MPKDTGVNMTLIGWVWYYRCCWKERWLCMEKEVLKAWAKCIYICLTFCVALVAQLVEHWLWNLMVMIVMCSNPIWDSKALCFVYTELASSSDIVDYTPGRWKRSVCYLSTQEYSRKAHKSSDIIEIAPHTSWLRCVIIAENSLGGENTFVFPLAVIGSIWHYVHVNHCGEPT